MVKKFINPRLAFIPLLILLLFATFARFYRFSERINFALEPATSLSISSEYIKKPTLLGMPSVRRTTSLGHIIYFGPWFNYSLVPLLLLFNYNPVGVTAFFVLLNLFVGMLIYIFASRVWNNFVGLFSSFLFLFNAVMINNSLFIWIVHYLPLIGILSLAVSYYWYKTRHPLYVFILGFLSGLAFNLEYLYLPTLLLVALFLLTCSKRKIQELLILMGGYY